MLEQKKYIYSLLMEVKDYRSALNELRKVYAGQSKDPFYWVNSIVACQKLGEHQRALDLAIAGLNEYPTSEPLNINAAHAHLSYFKDKSDISLLSRFLESVSLRAEKDYILARYHYFQSNYSESCSLLDQIEVKSPRYLNLYGENLVELQFHSKAIEKFTEALSIDDANVAANWNLSLSQIRAGDPGGWNRYRWGFLMPNNGRGDYIFDQKKRIQKQKDLDDTVIFWGEQGIGDCVFFSQFLPVSTVKHKIAVTERLVQPYKKYFGLNFDIIDISHIEDLSVPNLPLGDLPAFCLETTGCVVPRHSFRLRVPGSNFKKRVGICWRGGIDKKAQLRRSVPLGLFKRLSDFLLDFDVIPLQYNPVEEEILYLKKHFNNLTELSYDPVNELDKWVDDIFKLDALISVDNSAVHFAGAFGIPTFMLSNDTADFRWGLTNKNPWYRSVYRDISGIHDLDDRAQRIKDFIEKST